MFKFNKLKQLEERVHDLEMSRLTLTLKVKALSELVYNRLEEKYADKDGEGKTKKPTC